MLLSKCVTAKRYWMKLNIHIYTQTEAPNQIAFRHLDKTVVQPDNKVLIIQQFKKTSYVVMKRHRVTTNAYCSVKKPM